MKSRNKKSIAQVMRLLHRDIGFFVIGLSIIYSISGLLLIYRTTDFLKSERTIERHLPPTTPEADLGKMLSIWDFSIEKIEGNIVYFRGGTFDKSTGIVKYTEKSLPVFLDKLNSFHMASSNSASHWISVVFVIALVFLAISSFWMFKPKSKLFYRGLIFTGIGLVFAFVFIFLF